MKWRYGSCDWSAALGCGLWSKKFQSWITVANRSNPPWWKCRILYWLSLDATTSCPHVHALSLKNSRRDLIWPASILSYCHTTVFHYVRFFFSVKFYILGKFSFHCDVYIHVHLYYKLLKFYKKKYIFRVTSMIMAMVQKNYNLKIYRGPKWDI